ncbi:MAG: hypothetical protein K6B65_00465 [Bacilli bacterium]|nr:hypothetical protein [Bacilli bacterium]
MRKIPYIKSFVAIAVSLILILSSMNFFTGNAGAIAIGVFGLVTGLVFAGYAVLEIITAKGGKNPLPFVKDAFILSVLLVFYFVYTLIDVIYFYEGYNPADWVIAISMLLVTIAGATFGMLSVFLGEKLNMIRDISFGSFVAVFVVGIAIGYYGGGTIGSIVLTDLIILASFAFITVSNLKPIARKSEKEEAKEEGEEKADPITPESEEAVEPSDVLTDKLDIN